MSIASWFKNLFKGGRKVVETSKVTVSKHWIANGVNTSIVAVKEVLPAAGRTAAKVGGQAISRGAIGLRSIVKWAAGGAIFVWAYSALNSTSETISEVTGIPQEYVTLVLIVLGIVLIAYLLTVVTGVRRKTGTYHSSRRRR